MTIPILKGTRRLTNGWGLLGKPIMGVARAFQSMCQSRRPLTFRKVAARSRTGTAPLLRRPN